MRHGRAWSHVTCESRTRDETGAVKVGTWEHGKTCQLRHDPQKRAKMQACLWPFDPHFCGMRCPNAASNSPKSRLAQRVKKRTRRFSIRFAVLRL